MYHFFCKDPAPTEIYASWHSLALHDALPIYHATATGTPPFDPADPTQPGEPITPVPSTPDPSNPGTPGDPEIGRAHVCTPVTNAHLVSLPPIAKKTRLPPV